MSARLLDGFADPLAAPAAWDELLASAPVAEVFQRREWMTAWWESFGRGRLLLVAALARGRLKALLPLFADSGMVFLVGSGGSDYLDLVGDVGDDADLLAEALDVARAAAPGFLGFRFYHVLDESPTGPRLERAARTLGLSFHDEGSLVAPRLDLGEDGSGALAVALKSTVARRRRSLEREAPLRVEHHLQGSEAQECLEELFVEHVARWERTPTPSLFLDARQRAFFRRFVAALSPVGALRLSRLVWGSRAIAHHLGFAHRGRYLWYKPSFDVSLAGRSPGTVLLAALVTKAAEEGSRVFDFGIGDEPFKNRFASSARTVHTYGLYPASAGTDGQR